MTMPRKPGRPPRAAKASLERVEIRVTKAEKRDMERTAKRCGLTLSEWIRLVCSSSVEP